MHPILLTRIEHLASQQAEVVHIEFWQEVSKYLNEDIHITEQQFQQLVRLLEYTDEEISPSNDVLVLSIAAYINSCR